MPLLKYGLLYDFGFSEHKTHTLVWGRSNMILISKYYLEEVRGGFMDIYPVRYQDGKARLSFIYASNFILSDTTQPGNNLFLFLCAFRRIIMQHK